MFELSYVQMPDIPIPTIKLGLYIFHYYLESIQNIEQLYQVGPVPPGDNQEVIWVKITVLFFYELAELSASHVKQVQDM